VHAGGAIVNSGTLACRIGTYLTVTPELELSRRVFYMLASAFAQLFGDGPLPPDDKF
jgi:hypothetical protein